MPSSDDSFTNYQTAVSSNSPYSVASQQRQQQQQSRRPRRGRRNSNVMLSPYHSSHQNPRNGTKTRKKKRRGRQHNGGGSIATSRSSHGNDGRKMLNSRGLSSAAESSPNQYLTTPQNHPRHANDSHHSRSNHHNHNDNITPPSSIRSPSSPLYQYVPKSSLSPYQHVKSTLRTQTRPSTAASSSSSFCAGRSSSSRTAGNNSYLQQKQQFLYGSGGKRSTGGKRRRPQSAGPSSRSRRQRLQSVDFQYSFHLNGSGKYHSPNSNSPAGGKKTTTKRRPRTATNHSSHFSNSPYGGATTTSPSHQDLAFIHHNLSSLRKRQKKGTNKVQERIASLEKEQQQQMAASLSPSSPQQNNMENNNNNTSHSSAADQSQFSDLLQEIQNDFSSMQLSRHETRQFRTLNSARHVEQKQRDSSRPNTSAGVVHTENGHLAVKGENDGVMLRTPSPRSLRGKRAASAQATRSSSGDAAMVDHHERPLSSGQRPLSAKAMRSIHLLEKNHFQQRRRKRRQNPASDAGGYPDESPSQTRGADASHNDHLALDQQQVLDSNIDRPVMMENTSSPGTPTAGGGSLEAAAQRMFPTPSSVHSNSTRSIHTIRTARTSKVNTPNSRNGSPVSPRLQHAQVTENRTSEYLASSLMDYYESHAENRTELLKKMHSSSIPSLDSSNNGRGSDGAVNADKVLHWWTLLAKAIADARPKEGDNNALQKLMKIAIKKKEKEAVKQKEKMERSLKGLYTNKFLFTRRQLRVLLRNINRERFSDEVDNRSSSGEVKSPYKKRGDPADLLKKLTKRSYSVGNSPNGASSNSAGNNNNTSRSLGANLTTSAAAARMAMSPDAHVKAFSPYKSNVVIRSALDEDEENADAATGTFSDLSTPQATPQTPNSAKQSRLATHSGGSVASRRGRPQSAGASRKSKYKPSSANPASIVLEFQKMVL